MRTSEIQKPDLTELNSKIASLKIEISEDETSLEASRKASKRVSEIFGDLDSLKNKEVADELKKLYPLITKANNVDTLERFTNTLSLNLMVVNTRYVMVEGGVTLTSPAGFHSDTKVYVKPTGMVILTNRLPKTSNLSYYDLEKDA